MTGCGYPVSLTWFLNLLVQHISNSLGNPRVMACLLLCVCF